MFRAYNEVLIRRPILTQVVTASTLFGLGDFVAQQVVERKGRNHDIGRTTRLLAYGGLIFAPAMHKWYSFLSKVTLFSNTSKHANLIFRVSMDQLILAPAGAAVFYTSMTVFEQGFNRPAIKQRLENNWLPTLVRSWAVYVPVQFMNFTLFPPRFHLPVLSVVSLFWNAYLSYANDKAKKSEEREESEREELEEKQQVLLEE